MGSLKSPPKSDWTPLLPGGVHTVSLEQIAELAVAPYPNDFRRPMLFTALSNWTADLRRCGVKGKYWVCGSFMTEKPEPTDLDVILWNPVCATFAGEDPKGLLDVRKARETFALDLHVEPFHPDLTFFREAHHLGFYGFAHDRRTPRGIAEIILE